MSIVIVCIGVGLCLSLQIAILRRLHGLPERVWAILREERARGEARDVTALEEAAIRRVDRITASLERYEERAAAAVRAQVADAEARARDAARDAFDTHTALLAAARLVDELSVMVNRPAATKAEAP